MSGKSIDFDDKKYQKSEYYKNKKLTRIDDVDVNKVLVSKKNHMAQGMHLSTLLDIMMMMILDYYV